MTFLIPFFLSFLFGGFLPLAGNILIKKLPADLGGLFALVLRNIRKEKIFFSLRYAALSFLIYSFFFVSDVLPLAPFQILALSLALSLLVYTDEKDFLLPDALTIFLLAFGLYLALLYPDRLSDAVTGLLWGFILSLALGFVSTLKKPDSFGGGDMKLLMALGTFTGPLGLSALILCSLPFFILDFFIRGRKKFVPYGPSLILAFLIALLLIRSPASVNLFLNIYP